MRLLYATGAGGITCVSLLVGRLCSHRPCSPLLLITVSTYLPSGEMAVSAALPELITQVTNSGKAALTAISSIRRNGRECSLARVGDLGDREILEMSPACTVQQRVHSENRRGQNGQSGDRNSGSSPFVL